MNTISLKADLFKKFRLSKIEESWKQKMDLTDNDFMYLLLEEYPDPKQKKNKKTVP